MRRNFFTTLMTLMLVSFFAIAAFADSTAVNMDDPKMAPPDPDRTALEATGTPSVPLKADGTVCMRCLERMLARTGCEGEITHSSDYCTGLRKDAEAHGVQFTKDGKLER